MAKEQVGLTVKKGENFSEWYTQVIQKGDFADYTSVSGAIVFRPNSYLIWEKIQHAVDERLKRMGVKNAYFPLFIPEKLLKLEQSHVAGFTPEVAWVTEAGETKLAERFAVRPTSETIMYESYAKWIRSWRDLPLRLNQWNNVVRWEFKHPVPFLRTREFLWNEGHTAFATKDEAMREVEDVLKMYEAVLKDYLALPGVLGKKSRKETFAGAEYTTTIELYLPNGRGIQGPDSHHLGQNFSKAFGITFIDKDEKEKHVWQNSWAITTRMIGVLLAIHGDDKGAVLPPALAPIQVVIIPIIFDKTKKPVLAAAKKIVEQMEGMAVVLDDRDEYSAGWKFNEWELRGVPLRIEIGPKDLEKKQALLVRRDTGEKIPVKMAQLKKKVPLVLDTIQADLYLKAKRMLKQGTAEAFSMEEVVQAIEGQKIVRAPWCESQDCEGAIKDKTAGAKILNVPFDQPKSLGKCVHCGKPGKASALFGKSY